MNWAAIVLLVLVGVGILRGFGAMISGRPALKPPKSIGELIGRVVIYGILVGLEVWLIILAVTL